MSKSTLYQNQRGAHRSAFAAALRKLMWQQILNQPGLASATGIPRDQISRYCNGQSLPGPKNQVRLAAALGVDPSSLINGATQKEEKPVFLTKVEIEGLTGRKISRTQKQSLEAMKIMYRENGIGEIVVSRKHVERVLGGDEVEAQQAEGDLPNFAAIGG